MLSSVLVIVPFLAVINAANDWSVPCITGECSYDIPASTNGSASGTMTIWGSQDAITDITTAADWQILGCDPNALSQDIRLVCMSDDPAAKCSHLYQNTGAVGKVVRLPENCGSSAFARVSKAWVPEDQSIPASVTARLVRRDGTQPQVKALSLDTDFDAVDYSKTGAVNIAIQGANVPGASGTFSVPPSKRNSRVAQRGLVSFVKNAVSSIATNSINVNKTLDLPPLNFDKKANLFNKTITCGPVKASVSADVDANANAAASVGVAASGTLIPPKITDFGVIAGLTASVSGTLDLTADVAGQIDSGKITLVNIGIPGLDFPGILTIGPSFQVQAQATANLDVNLDMNVGINFDVKNAQLSFPPGTGDATNGKAFSIGDTPLTLSASPDVAATGTLTAHIIPSLNLGVSALGNKVSAQVFFEVDGSASLKLSLDASADAQTVIGGSSSTTTTDESSTTVNKSTSYKTTKSMAYHTTTAAMSHYTTMTHSTAKSMMHTTTTAKAMSSSAAAPKASASASASSKQMYDRAVTSSFGGCFEVDAGIAVNAGADGSFFGLFDKNAQDTLFSKNFVIFKKCFGAAASRRSMFRLSRLQRQSALGRRAGLTCPAAGLKSPASLVSPTVVKSAAIKAI
ncbi:hypothetical protein C8R44DRAFT_864873 [Mycena epipterygia]|nr:hypothetical protein C8R44DRAFT_864873 [Mycena epipterygia]